MCVTGGVLGCIIAFVGASAVEAAIRALINLGVQGSIVRMTPGLIGSALIVSILLGFFAGLYPAWRAASMRPIEAIREGE